MKIKIATLAVMSASLALTAQMAFGGNWDTIPLENRIEKNEQDIAEIKQTLNRLIDRLDGKEVVATTKAEPKADCACPLLPCNCDKGDCKCKNCKTCPTKATEHAFSGEGREVVVVGTSSCPNCPAAHKAADANGLPYYDAEKDPKGRQLAARYGIDSFPRVLVFSGGVLDYTITSSYSWPAVIRREANGGGDVARSGPPTVTQQTSRGRRVRVLTRVPWGVNGDTMPHLTTGVHARQLAAEGNSDLSGFSFRELSQIHSNLHETGRSGIVGNGLPPTQTVRRTSLGPSRVIWTQPLQYTQQGASGCASCRYR